MNRTCRSALALAAVALAPAAAAADGPLSKAEVAKLAKPATALVETKTATGSGFCVHPAGLFVTNNHVVENVADAGTVTLVLNAGETTQKSLKAKIVRRDKALDLALLKCEADQPLPFVKLGSDEKLGELEELVALGFPFGTGLAKPGAYPTVSVNASAVSALRKDAKGNLDRIQIDGALNPGNSGGPVLDKKGEVVGVVVSGIRGAGITMAIPVGHVRRFAERPEVALVAPDIKPENRAEAVEFKATVASVLAADEAFDVEIVIASDGAERRFPMKADGTSYVAKATPFASATAASTVTVEIKYPEGTVTLPVADFPLTFKGKDIKLSDLKSVRFGAKPQITLKDNTVATGSTAGLDAVPATLGGRPYHLTTERALELTVKPAAAAGSGSYKLTVIASRKGKEVGRAEFAALPGRVGPEGRRGGRRRRQGGAPRRSWASRSTRMSRTRPPRGGCSSASRSASASSSTTTW